MGAAALHSCRWDNQNIALNFVPAHPANLLTPARREQQRPHNTVVVAFAGRASPNEPQLVWSENPLARLLAKLGHISGGIVASD